MFIVLDKCPSLIHRFEGGGSGSIESRMSTPIAAKESIFYVKALLHWYDKYLSALDCYTWIATAQLVNPASLLFGKLFYIFIYVYLVKVVR